jgi:hypothetical protein
VRSSLPACWSFLAIKTGVSPHITRFIFTHISTCEWIHWIFFLLYAPNFWPTSWDIVCALRPIKLNKVLSYGHMLLPLVHTRLIFSMFTCRYFYVVRKFECILCCTHDLHHHPSPDRGSWHWMLQEAHDDAVCPMRRTIMLHGFQYFRRELFTEMVHTCFFVVKVHNWIYHEANKNVFFFNSVHYLLWFSLQCYIYMIFICCKSMLQTTNFVFGIFSFCRNATYVFFVT